MGRRVLIVLWLLFLLLHLFLSSGEYTKVAEGTSTTKKDVTTPITTVPTTSQDPILNYPNSNPEMEGSPGGSWCIASQSASQSALQVALDYACGYGGADCSAIQPGATCYNPDTLHHHASFAFNQYYQKNPIPSSCNFGGTAVTTSTDPSTGACHYQSTSTSSSVLNTTNSNGSTVFGTVPSSPTTPAAAAAPTAPTPISHLFTLAFLLLFLPKHFHPNFLSL